MSEDTEFRKKTGLARRLFRVVGTAGSTVGGIAGGILKSAGQTAKNAGGRASLTFSSEVEFTEAKDLRELAESFTQWLVQEHQGKADLQQQKPSTIELTEYGQVKNFYQIRLEEPGLAGRRFLFVFRTHPLAQLDINIPTTEEAYHDRALLVVHWPQELLVEPESFGITIWDEAAFVGERSPALNLMQHWLKSIAGGTFRQKVIGAEGEGKRAKQVPIFGRDEELLLAEQRLLSPRKREDKERFIISIAARGGTGKSFFLKALKARIGHRVVWAGVDHQGIAEDVSSVALLGRILAQLARQLEERSVKMERFGKELRSFRKRMEQQEGEPSGFFGHLKKAAETAAAINPVIGVASAGVIFFTSWGQEAKEESEALAKDNAIKALTDAFKEDLIQHVEEARASSVCWQRPVIVFDTYEWLAPLVDIWMRTEFLANDFLHDTGVCLVISGREHLLRTDTRWSELQHQISNISLKPFGQRVSDEFLTTLGVESERREELYGLTEGLPLFLSLVAQIEDLDQATGILAKRVLEEIPDKHNEHFMMASVLDSFERNNLEVLYRDLEPEQVSELVTLLGRASFTAAKDGKRAFIKPVRKILERALVLELGENYANELKNRLSEV